MARWVWKASPAGGQPSGLPCHDQTWKRRSTITSSRSWTQSHADHTTRDAPLPDPHPSHPIPLQYGVAVHNDVEFISVVVPTRNRAALLDRLLRSLARVTYPTWEVVVVDDGSTDDTRDVVDRHRAAGLPVSYYFQTWQKMGAARNLGIEHALGPIVAFTDDDCLVEAGWLEAIAAAFEAHPGALGVQGQTRTDRAAMTPFTRQVEQLEAGQPYRTCNIAYRTQVVRHLGGFDPHLIRGEDVVMGMRVLERGPIVFAPEAVVIHPPRPKEWAGREAWRTLLASEAHFRRAYPGYAPARSQTLSLQKPEHVVSRWLLLPIRRYWRWHWAYLRRNPRDYLRHVPLIIGEKLALFSVLPSFLLRWKQDRAASRSGFRESGSE